MDRPYENKLIDVIKIDCDSGWPRKTEVSARVDTYAMTTIRFGDSFTLRINNEDVDALRQLLLNASIEAIVQTERNNLAEEESEETESDVDDIRAKKLKHPFSMYDNYVRAMTNLGKPYDDFDTWLNS